MKYDPKKHHRRSIRLKGHDYASPGAYFVTICVQGRECLLGDVSDGKVSLSLLGQIAEEFWENVTAHFALSDVTHIAVDSHITMPNHIHAIITIHDPAGGGAVAAPTCTAPVSASNSARRADGWDRYGREQGGGTRGGMLGGETPPLRKMGPTLGQIVAYYKYQTTKLVNEMRDMPGVRLWQRNYWEHIIRDLGAYQRIYQYIENNPVLWEEDQLHPDAPPNRFNRG